MAKFKHVRETFIIRNLLGFQGNMYQNYNGSIDDENFFDVLQRNFDHDKAVELIIMSYSKEELEPLCKKTCHAQLDLTDSLGSIFVSLWNNEQTRSKCRAILKSINEFQLEEVSKVPNERIGRRFGELRDALSLTDLEYSILLCGFMLCETCFTWPLSVPDISKPKFYAMALDRSHAEVLQALAPNGKLRKFEFVDGDFDFNNHLLGSFLDGSSNETIQRRFYCSRDDVEVLPWNFFGELATKDGAVLKKLLAAHPRRCNVLLYGAPGTGKTSFARALAKETGRTAWEIRQGDADGRNMAAGARMVGIQVCNSQESHKTSLMVIDEADELLRSNGSVYELMMGGGHRSTEKGITNALLDEMQMPAIWISNTPAELMDESVRRRFDYSIRFEELNTSQRVSIWRNVVAKYHLEKLIPEQSLAGYASEYATSAGGIAIVLENLKRMKPKKDKVAESIALLMKPHCELLGLEKKSDFLPSKGYSLEGLNIKSKVRLDQVVTAIANFYDAKYNAASEDRPRMNLLMYGPPGCGKTEFCKYLGNTLNRKVVVVRGSDILGKYVGESEKNIARAFRRAEDEHAILFLDEVDGLLRTRSAADHGWEVTQVNELLQQMENFNGVMIAATNFSTNLDPATMRRFTFKLAFDYLDNAGKKIFFERMFKTTLTEQELAELDSIPNLAPGDFRTVRQEQFYLGANLANADRIAALREESKLKKDQAPSANPIGFAAA